MKKAYEQSPAAVKKWLDEDYPAIAARAKAEGAEIHWGDESGLRSDDVRGRGFAPKGHTPVIARREAFPARFQFVGAMNPCPCGYLGSPHKACRCTPDQVARYQGKLSGPLLDRIDLHVEVPTIAPEQLLTAPAGESTGAIRRRCELAREVAMQRQGKANQGLQGKEIDTHTALDAAAAKFLNIAAARLGWSGVDLSHCALAVWKPWTRTRWNSSSGLRGTTQRPWRRRPESREARVSAQSGKESGVAYPPADEASALRY
jgi:hypothetical protein